jgi:type IX secretion system PorP/SprF family membrane protein
MKKFWTNIVFLVSVLLVQAQQETQYSQWMWNHVAYNPAIAGIQNCSKVKTMSRLQWVGFEGAPISNLITFTTPIKTKRTQMFSPRQGFGVKFERDDIGPFTSNGLSFTYAVHFNFTQATRISFGLNLGAKQMIFSNRTITTYQPDPATQKSSTFYSPIASFGTWWDGKNYFIGLSLDQLTTSKWIGMGVQSNYRLHYNLSTGFRFRVNDSYTIVPNLLVKKTINSPASIDLNTFLDFKDAFKIGLGIRNNESFIGMMQVRFKDQFAFGYSVDFISSKINTVALLTHELSFHYSSCETRPTDKLSCPLF